MARFRSVSQYYDSLVAGGETRVKALGVGKTVFHSSLSNFVGSSVSPVVEDGAAGATWSGWSATQRDFYIIGPDGSLIHKVNLSPGFFAADIDAIVQAALAALSAGGVGCPGDVNSDGVVDVNDLLALLSAFGTTTDAGSDITGDGLVDVNDLLQCLSAFGNTCTAAAAAPAPAPVAAVPCALGGDCGGQVFNSCGTMCPPTCGVPMGMCNMMCNNGFQCPNGQLWDPMDGVAGMCVNQSACSGGGGDELPPGMAAGRPFLSAKAAPTMAMAVEQAVSDWMEMAGPDGKHNHDGRHGGDYGQEEEL